MANRLNTHFEPFPNEYNYNALRREDGSEDEIFIFMFPKGSLRPRMSALELCEFIKPHMASMISQGILSGLVDTMVDQENGLSVFVKKKVDKIKAQFEALFVKLMLTPKSELDELLPWIRVIWSRETIKYANHDKVLEPNEGCDTVYLNLSDKRPQAAGPTYSLPEA